MYKDGIKRFLDVVLSLLIIIVFSWLLVILALLTALLGDGVVIFRQKRAGRNGTYFTIYKFPTMTRDTPSELATDVITESQISYTRIGRFLEKTSLNELPQLFNILKGDMSLVGPRPALWNQFELIERRRELGVDKVRPGLTGWAQINGRDNITLDRKLELDDEYVNNLSFAFDCRCFFGTFLPWFKAQDIAHAPQAPQKSKDSLCEKQLV